MVSSGKHKTYSRLLFFKVFLVCFLLLISSGVALSQQSYPPTTYGNNQPYYDSGSNYSTDTPFKTEVARLEAFVYRPGKETLPLMQVPRLSKGDVLKIKVLNEPVNGISPDQSNYDWSLMVAFINPSRNQDKENTLSEEIRLKEKGWYKDYFFTVPYDCQPIIFLYPKSKYRDKILSFIEKRPDDIRLLGEKVIEISSAYAQVSSFLFQLQDLMIRQSFNSSYGGSSYDGSSYGLQSNNQYVEQSIEGLARSFNLQLPSCWNNNSYSSNLQSRAQCVTKNIRLEDLNFSVSRMLQQGALLAISQLTKSHPGLSKWIAIAAIAIDFIMKLTRKAAIRIIPAISSSAENPLYIQGSYNNQSTYYNPNNSSVGNSYQSTGSNNKITLYAMSQPTDRDFVTVYAFVPHKWQPDADPEVFHLYPPVPDKPCLSAGKNLLRNNDLRLEWLTDTFTRDFKIVLSDKNGWSKEFDLRKNLGFNSWEAEISKEDLALIPKTSVPFDAKITGIRGFNKIESPSFQLSVSNGGNWEAETKLSENGKTKVVLRKISGNGVCSQNVIYKSKIGEQAIFPLTKDNNFVKFSDDKGEISFEVDAANAQTESIQIQQFGGEMVTVTVKP